MTYVSGEMVTSF